MSGTARVGDSHSHGGNIISGSSDTITNGVGTAKIGDTAYCVEHGNVSVISGATGTMTNGPLTARVNDSLSCGATIINGSTDRIIGDGGSAGISYHLDRTVARMIFQDGTIAELGESDIAAWDDEELYPGDPRIGVVVYPLIGTSRDDIPRTPTSNEIKRSEELGYDPSAEEIPTRSDDKPGNPPAPIIPGCSITEIDYNQLISPNFTLGFVSSKAVVSPTLIKAQRDLTELQIACNLQLVCINLLEPMAAQFGRSKIGVTSGFRKKKNGRSQHEIGQAVDIQFSDQWSGALSKADWWDRVLWVRDNINFDQMIVEYIGRKPWIHLSFNPNGNRAQQLTCIKNGRFEPGLKLL
jgi:uncharacterized Zn-binding protein involved in type VI secretion